MEITISKTVLASMLKDAAELGAKAALTQLGLNKPYISKFQAYKAYGRGVVDRWIQEGLVTPRKDGTDTAKWRIDRLEIEAIAKASNRPSYLTVIERQNGNKDSEK